MVCHDENHIEYQCDLINMYVKIRGDKKKFQVYSDMI